MSAQPGWYPDPQDPDRARYWDGHAWAAGQGGAAGGGGGRPGRGNRWWVLLVVALVVVLALVFLLPRLLGGDAVAEPDPDPTGPRPTESQWDELPVTESPTPTPSESPSSGEEVLCPRGEPDDRASVSDSDWIRGGGLAFPHPGSGWDATSMSVNIPWAHDADGLRSSGGAWYNVVIVAELHETEGFTDPKASAHTVFDCQASGAYYTSVEQVEVLLDEPIEVDGLQGWYVQGRIHSSSGLVDRVDVIVLDDGDRLPTFHGVVNSEEAPRVADVEEVMAGLRYEG